MITSKIVYLFVTLTIAFTFPNSINAQSADLARSVLEEYDSHQAVSFTFTLSVSDGEISRKIYKGYITASTESSLIPTYPSTRLLLVANALNEEAQRDDYVMSKINDRFEVWDKQSEEILTSRQHRFGARLFLAYQQNNLTFFSAMSQLRSVEPGQMHFGNDIKADGKVLKELVIEQPQQGSRTKYTVDASRNHIIRVVLENDEGDNLIYEVSELQFYDEEPGGEDFAIDAPANYPRSELLLGNVPAPGTLVEGWELETLDGETIHLDDLKGQVVLLDFWATWCVNCQFTFPEIAELREHFSGRPLTVLGMNYMENKDPVAYMKERGYDWTLVDGTPMGDEFQLEQTGLPILIILNKTGRVADFVVGYNPWQEGVQFELLKETIEQNL